MCSSPKVLHPSRGKKPWWEYNSETLSHSFFSFLWHPSVLFPPFPEHNRQLKPSGTPFFSQKALQQIFKKYYLLRKNVYVVYFAVACVFYFFSFRSSPLQSTKPGVVYFCEQVARARTGMSTSLRQQWKITWKGHDCDKVSLHLSVEKYKASVDFAELSRSRMIWSQTSPSLT